MWRLGEAVHAFACRFNRCPPRAGRALSAAREPTRACVQRGLGTGAAPTAKHRCDRQREQFHPNHPGLVTWSPPTQRSRPSLPRAHSVQYTVAHVPTTQGTLELATEPPSRKLVGRARETLAIARALSDAESGRGRLVLLAGEPGIGKTSLADAATTVAEERGFSVLWGRCWESGGAPAYWPWLGVLSSMALALDDLALAKALGDGAPVLAEILPEWRSRLPPPSTGASPPAEEARFRVFRGIVALAREASRLAAHGIAVVLDDLHAADRSSLLLLHFLARELRGLKMLVIATYRDVEARMDAETSELIARIGREGTVLSLGRLASQECADLVQAHVGGVAERVSARILERAQGNPLFLEEMLRLYSEQGPESIDAGVVPHGVRDVIGQRLMRVSAETRALLELGAVAGDEIEPALLAAAAGSDPEGVAGALGEAARAGVLLDLGERRRFAHALFREVLYRDLSPERRRELHSRVATALEGSVGSRDALRHDEIAYHALAGSPGLLERGVAHALAAARRAQELLAYDDAVETLERALAAFGKQGELGALRARVLVALGEACIRRGDQAGGKRYCREAAAIARTLGDAELAANAALVYGRVFAFGNVDPVLVGMLESSLEALPPGDSALRARLLGRLAGALQPTANVAEPVGVARDAIETARRLGDKQTLLEVLHDSISAMMDCTAPAEVYAYNLEAEVLCRELGDRERLLRTHGRLFFSHLSRGELAPADARIEAYEALAEQLAAPWLAFRSRFFRAVRATMHGRFAEAEGVAFAGDTQICFNGCEQAVDLSNLMDRGSPARQGGRRPRGGGALPLLPRVPTARRRASRRAARRRDDGAARARRVPLRVALADVACRPCPRAARRTRAGGALLPAHPHGVPDEPLLVLLHGRDGRGRRHRGASG